MEMNNPPLVSFVVPVYNVEAYIRQCMDSLLAQTVTDFEIIAVDDESPDNCPDILDEYAGKDARVRVLHQKNSGPSGARNNGMLAARGKWLVFVDGDDWLDSDALEKTLPYCDEGLDICFFTYKSIHAKKVQPVIVGADRPSLGPADFLDIQKDILDTGMKRRAGVTTISTPWGKVFSRSFLLESSVFFNTKLRTAEDLLFNLELFGHAKTGKYLDLPLYNYRFVPSSSTNRYRAGYLEILYEFVSQVKLYMKKNDLEQALRQQYMERLALTIGEYCMSECCHPDNPKPYSVRKKEFLSNTGSSPFKEAFNSIQPGEFSPLKRLMILLIKNHWFWLLNFLVKLRIFANRRLGLGI